MRKKQNNSLQTRIWALAIGFSVNVLGNSLTIVSNMGAEPWTAAAVNLSKVAGLSVGSFVIFFGAINALLNQAIVSMNKTSNFADKPRFVEELLYIFIFGYAIDICTFIMTKIGLTNLSRFWRIVMSLVGVTLFCMAISIYQRANLFMHPNDDTSNLIRFRFLKGSALLSQTVDIIPALIICGLCGLYLGNIYSINVGTIYSIFCNGLIIGSTDKLVWPQLKHNHREKHKYF